MNTLPQGLASLPQGLVSLPNDIILLIFNQITLITDKRQFLRICIQYNKITRQSMDNFENNYSIKHFDKINDYCMEKFTLELCHDKYFDRIPKSYVIPNNNILINALAAFYTPPLLQIDENINYGFIDYCKYAFTKIKKSFSETDNINILELAKNNGCDLMKIYRYCVIYGNLECLKWTIQNYCDFFSWKNRFGCKKNLSWICDTAALNGHLNILIWAREHDIPWDSVTCSSASLNGHLGCLKWARKNGCEWNQYTCAYAAQNGKLECLKWAREKGCEWNEYTCSLAASNGHLEILKWARENGCVWDFETCEFAAENGQLECLIWARENGCDWNKNTCSSAVKNGHLECLVWARENGCDWDSDVYRFAEAYDQQECLKWAIENSCPI